MDEKPFRPALPTEPPPAEYDPMRLPFTLPLVPVPPLDRVVGEEAPPCSDGAGAS